MEFIRKQYAVTPPGGGGGGAAGDEASRLASSMGDVVSESTQLRLDLTSIATLLKDSILAAMASLRDEAGGLDDDIQKVALAVGRNLKKEVEAVQKGTDKVRSLSASVGKHLGDSAKIEAQIKEVKMRQVKVEEMITELKILQGDLTEEQANYAKIITEELKEQRRVLEALVEKSKDMEQRFEAISSVFKGLAKIPFIGQLINANKVVDQMKKKFQETGSNWKALTTGIDETFKSIGKSLLNPLSIATSLFGIFKALFMMAINYNKKIFETAKILGTSASQAERLRGAFQAMGPLGLMAKETAESYAQISDSLGFMGPVTNDFAINMALIQKRTGASAAHMGAVAQQAALSGKSVGKTYSIMMGAAKLEGARNKLALTARQIMEGISKVSSTVVLNLQGSTSALAAAVVRATKLGTTLNDVNKQGEALLDFETSIASQFEAEVLSGKTYNLEKARSLFLAGKTVEAMEEMNRAGVKQEDFMKMDMITKEAVAKMAGKTTEELSKQFILQKQAEVLGAKEGQSLANRYAYLVKMGQTHDQIAAKIGAQEAADLRRQSMADQWQDTLERLKDLLGRILQGPVSQILNKIIGFVSNTKLVAAFGEKVKVVFQKVADVLSDLPNILQRAVEISKILASLAIARAVASTVTAIAGSSAISMGVGAIAAFAAGGAMYSWLTSLTDGLMSGGGAGGGMPSQASSTSSNRADMGTPEVNSRRRSGARATRESTEDRLVSSVDRLAETVAKTNQQKGAGFYIDGVKTGGELGYGMQKSFTARMDNSTNLATGTA